MYSYILQSGRKIDMDGLLCAMEDTGESRYFLDLTEGEIGEVNTKTKQGKEKCQRLSSNKRYVEIPKIRDENRIECMRECMDMFLKEGNKGEQKLHDEMQKILDSNDTNKFKKALVKLEKSRTGWIHGWEQFRRDSAWEDAVSWIEKLPVAIEQKFEGCGDCKLCTLMEKGEHDMDDFLEAVKKEKKKKPRADAKQDKEFIDTYHDVTDDYYKLMEAEEHSDDDIYALIGRDPDFYDSYLFLADAFRDEDKNEEDARELEDRAFSRALERITDKKGNWPEKLQWGFIENRHVIRALATGADNLWKDGKLKESLDIYRKLLRSNLSDNMGARYAIVALRMDMPYDEYIKQVWPKERMPAQHIDNWFDKNAPSFADELQEWKNYCKKEFGLSDNEFPF